MKQHLHYSRSSCFFQPLAVLLILLASSLSSVRASSTYVFAITTNYSASNAGVLTGISPSLVQISSTNAIPASPPICTVMGI